VSPDTLAQSVTVSASDDELGGGRHAVLHRDTPIVVLSPTMFPETCVPCPWASQWPWFAGLSQAVPFEFPLGYWSQEKRKS
jgi:hypothetical protein